MNTVLLGNEYERLENLNRSNKLYAIKRSNLIGPVGTGRAVPGRAGIVNAHPSYYRYFGISQHTKRYGLITVGELASRVLTIEVEEFEPVTVLTRRNIRRSPDHIVSNAARFSGWIAVKGAEDIDVHGLQVDGLGAGALALNTEAASNIFDVSSYKD